MLSLNDYGVNTGSVDAYPALNRTVALNQHVIADAGVYLINTNITLNATNALWGFGGILKPANGVNITLNCPIECPAGVVLFDLSLGGTISGTPLLETFWANWILGVDPTFTLDATAGINIGLAFCTGAHKPKLGFTAGRFKITGQLTKGQSFFAPIIFGAGGGDQNTSDRVTAFDASTASFAVDGSGNSPPILYIKGGSGRQSRGSVRDIQFIGNDSCEAVQVADQCGYQIRDCTITHCRDGVEFFNEALGSNLTGTGGGFTEAIVVRDVHINSLGRYGFSFRRNTNGTTQNAADSFNNVKLENCWVNLPGTPVGTGLTAAVRVGPGCNWYNGKAEVMTFFGAGSDATHIPSVIQCDAAAAPSLSQVPPQLRGHLTCEGGSGRAVLGSGGTIWWAGTEGGINGVKYGTLIPVHSIWGLGPEANPANGQFLGRRRPYEVTGTPSLTQLTTVGVTAAASAVSITLTSAAGYVNGSVIGIGLDTGATFWSTVSGAPVGAVVTLATPLPSQATAANPVFTPTAVANIGSSNSGIIVVRVYATNYEQRIALFIHNQGFGGVGRCALLDNFNVNQTQYGNAGVPVGSGTGTWALNGSMSSATSFISVNSAGLLFMHNAAYNWAGATSPKFDAWVSDHGALWAAYNSSVGAGGTGLLYSGMYGN